MKNKQGRPRKIDNSMVVDLPDINSVLKELSAGGSARVFGLGKFTVKKRKGRVFLHNRGGIMVKTPARKGLHFAPDKDLKTLINNKNGKKS